MTNEQVKQILAARFPELSEWEEQYGLLTFRAPAAKNLEVLQYLFNEAELQFQFLTDLTGVHYPDRAGEELCVVYHLHNLVQNFRMRIKVYVPVAAPDVYSATPVFSGANWMERETYDFYGINFVGHPELNRILNVDEMDYFPMRKEYPMEDPTRTDKDDEMFGRG
jgi:NADH-quinone oxidoreductase subunit C